jgi:hypothetical protein
MTTHGTTHMKAGQRSRERENRKRGDGYKQMTEGEPRVPGDHTLESTLTKLKQEQLCTPWQKAREKEKRLQ